MTGALFLCPDTVHNAQRRDKTPCTNAPASRAGKCRLLKWRSTWTTSAWNAEAFGVHWQLLMGAQRSTPQQTDKHANNAGHG